MIVKLSNGQVFKRSESLRNTLDLQSDQSSEAEMAEDELINRSVLSLGYSVIESINRLIQLT
jgi:hypothetical protein